MPTYEYKCDSCGYRFEEFQSITAAPLTTCPECGGRVQRLIGSGNGFIFKGSGFYITDYRSDSYKKAKAKEKEEKSDSSSSKKDAGKSTSSKKVSNMA